MEKAQQRRDQLDPLKTRVEKKSISGLSSKRRIRWVIDIERVKKLIDMAENNGEKQYSDSGKVKAVPDSGVSGSVDVVPPSRVAVEDSSGIECKSVNVGNVIKSVDENYNKHRKIREKLNNSGDREIINGSRPKHKTNLTRKTNNTTRKRNFNNRYMSSVNKIFESERYGNNSK